MNPPEPIPRPKAAKPLAVVRFSLPELLAELDAERNKGAYAMEKLGQVEIEKLVKARTARHAKRKA